MYQFTTTTVINENKDYTTGSEPLFKGEAGVLKIKRHNNFKKENVAAIYKRAATDPQLAQIQFTIPVEDNDWHYNLIKFPSNLWDTKIIANGDEVLDTVLFPSYTRQTQEEIGMPDIFTITLRNVKWSIFVS